MRAREGTSVGRHEGLEARQVHLYAMPHTPKVSLTGNSQACKRTAHSVCNDEIN